MPKRLAKFKNYTCLQIHKTIDQYNLAMKPVNLFLETVGHCFKVAVRDCIQVIGVRSL